ncbi:hypothetical protein [Saccharospirillum impatiens]|uniref:hypothetical protein n=1 Tax=Saccharospirillum impatiens TaxID=169438 RepID=UPI0004099F26|nr:hypothetical protein [Saccharospirillum impatiens]
MWRDDGADRSAQMWRSTHSLQTTETWSEGQQIDRVEDTIDREQLDDLAHQVEVRREDKDDQSPSPDRSGVNVTHWWRH